MTKEKAWEACEAFRETGDPAGYLIYRLMAAVEIKGKYKAEITAATKTVRHR